MQRGGSIDPEWKYKANYLDTALRTVECGISVMLVYSLRYIKKEVVYTCIFIVITNFTTNLLEQHFDIIRVLYYSISLRNLFFILISGLIPFYFSYQKTIPLHSTTDVLKSVRMALLDEKSFSIFFEWLEDNGSTHEFNTLQLYLQIRLFRDECHQKTETEHLYK